MENEGHLIRFYKSHELQSNITTLKLRALRQLSKYLKKLYERGRVNDRNRTIAVQVIRLGHGSDV